MNLREFQADIAEEARRSFNLGTLISLTPLQSSDWSMVARIETSGGVFALKACRGPIGGNMPFQHELLRHLASESDVVLPPLRSRTGASWFMLGDMQAAFFPFVVGDAADPGRRAHRLAAAGLLASLHRRARAFVPVSVPSYPAFGELDWACNPLWRWEDVFARLERTDALLAALPAVTPEDRRVASDVVSRAGLLAHERLHVQAWLASLAARRDLARGPIHGDYYDGNLLTRGDRVVAAIDWDESRVDWLVYELARATWEFCHVGPRLDVPRAREFIAAYMRAGGPVPTDELALVVPFIRAVRVEEILRELAEPTRTGRWDSSRLAYVHHCFEALSHLDGLAVDWAPA